MVEPFAQNFPPPRQVVTDPLRKPLPDDFWTERSTEVDDTLVELVAAEPSSLTPLPMLQTTLQASTSPGYQRPPAVGDPTPLPVNHLLGSAWREFWLPLLLFSIGCVLYAVRGIEIERSTHAGLEMAAVEISLNLAFVALICAMFAKVSDMNLGPAGPGIMKMAALAAFPTGISGLIFVATPYWVMPIYLLGCFALALWLLSYLAELDLTEGFIPTLVMCMGFAGSFELIHTDLRGLFAS